MTRPMRTSRQGLDLIKSFEGFRARSTALDGGRWIIGYGHTKTAREGLTISEADAAQILRHYDLPPVEAAINRLVLAPINQNQFDALVSFAANLGIETFRGSDVLAYVNAGEPLKASCAMGAWRKADINGQVITVDALVRRRAMERALFLESPRGRPVAPSPIVRPQRDTRRIEPPLLDTPVNVDASVYPPATAQPGPQRRQPTSQPTSEPATERTSTETARRIGERVTRILNESPGLPPDRSPDRPSPTSPTNQPVERPAPPGTPPPTADDITAAIAAIADGPRPSEPDDDVTTRPETQPDIQPGAATAPATPGKSTTNRIIDDLEPIEVLDLPPAGPPKRDWQPLAGMGLAALVGILAAGWGLRQVGRIATGRADFTNEWAMLIGPFAVVAGTVLVAIMAYAAAQKLFQQR